MRPFDKHMMELSATTFFFMISFLHRLESRTRPILTPYDGRRRWDSNLRTPAYLDYLDDTVTLLGNHYKRRLKILEEQLHSMPLQHNVSPEQV